MCESKQLDRKLNSKALDVWDYKCMRQCVISAIDYWDYESLKDLENLDY